MKEGPNGPEEKQIFYSSNTIIPIAFNVKIRFVGENDVDFLTKKPKVLQIHNKQDRLNLPWSGLSSKDFIKLRKFEPILLSWLKESKKNAILFAVDPINALKKAGLEIPYNSFKDLYRLREKNIAVEPWLPNIRLNTITIDVKEPPKKFSPNPNLPFNEKGLDNKRKRENTNDI